MPQFGHQDGFDTVAYITGPSHVALGIRFGEGPLQLIKRPPAGVCGHDTLDEGRIIESINAGLVIASEELGIVISASGAFYVADDPLRYELFQHCAYLLASRRFGAAR